MSSSKITNMGAHRLADRLLRADAGEWQAVVMAALRDGWAGPLPRQVVPGSDSMFRRGNARVMVRWSEDQGGVCALEAEVV